MKYRIVEVSPPGMSDIYWEVEQEIPIPDAYCKHWEFVSKFSTIESCRKYINSRSEPTRKVISEYEV